MSWDYVRIYTLQETEVLIKAKQKQRNIERLIVKVCKKEPLFHVFTRVIFELQNPLEDSDAKVTSKMAAVVDMNEFMEGIIKIYINTTTPLELIKESIIHELTHQWHHRVSGVFHKRAKINERLAKTLARNLKVELAQKSGQMDLARMRIILSDFFRLLYIEGLAMYYQKTAVKEIWLDERIFRAQYETAKKDAERIEKTWMIYLSSVFEEDKKRVSFAGALQQYLESCCYSIGLHMVYSVLYVDHRITFESLAHFTSFRFVKEYETCMASRGWKPLVSVSSGEGILDYHKLISTWWRICQIQGLTR